ncbi:PREDICTED: serine/arginine repetitive matrix protein 1-like isoform X2 [Amphimedon queenslandica]|uniref:SH2 domain-containing protein n=1 Tax=Amphimedon queenslandica TaxID=400682 RepID=A0AAN0IQD6_AMPQE|nr:PREDICTED: serine/arginine repetitive matrix protein 1-like isoform X2 [Amphimedon queenslandica]|eukprot:XP_011406570.2 PREDICTED: serine/arginine repetitive matrix protein 1-like isoform X2 [Amphimedon queenslandica]
MADLVSIPGYFNVSRDQAKQLIAPHLSTDGYYIIRPTDGDALCTICVSKNMKLMNYRMFKDAVTGHYYIRDSKFPTITSLIKHYQKFPINKDVNTFLLYPVQQEQEQEEYVALVPSQQESTRLAPASSRAKMPLPQPASSPRHGSRDMERRGNNERREPNNTMTGGGGGVPKKIPDNKTVDSLNNIAQLPGVHIDLSKNDVPTVMQAFLSQEGAYLVRPSVSSSGQFTISLTCQNSILNFKINTDPDGKVFITPKKKFSSIRELLEGHKVAPLRSKARPGAKVYLLVPITVEAVQELLLPAGWQQFFDDNYKRHYFYNMQTGQSSWERPRAATAPAPSLPSKAMTMGPRISNRPLPSLPQEENAATQRKSLDVGRPNVTKMAGESPGLPGRRISDGSHNPPPLPSKGPAPSVGRRDPQPALPSKGHDLPPLPSKNEPPLPSKNEHSPPLPPLPTKHNEVPPLPSKTDAPPLPSKTPPLPVKEPSPAPSFPPLPSKSDPAPPQLPSKDPKTGPPPPPPLPSKDPLPSLPPKEDDFMQRKKRPVEYMDTVITKTPPSPTLPQKSGGSPPLPPPPPPIGAPVPPPPPPLAPPSPADSPSQRRNTTSGAPPTKKEIPPPSPSPSEGRPFTINDLVRAKSLLKKKEEDDEPQQPKGGGGGLHDVFSNALNQRMTSIRSAMTNSDDEDTDIEEVDDEDWDD